MPTEVRDIPALRPYKERLIALGMTTLELFVSATYVVSPELSVYLGVENLNSLLSQISSNVMAMSEETINLLDSLPCALGALVDEAQPLDSAPPISLAPSESNEVNLIAELPPVRHQGSRGTCVAHALLSAYEHYLLRAGAGHDMSEQFLYWNCKENDLFTGKEGTLLSVAFPLMKRDGCCLESTWQYNPNVIPGSIGHGPPPPEALIECLAYRLPTFKKLSPTSVSDMKSELSHGRCVSISIPVCNSWHRSREVRRTGAITNPVPGETFSGGHAMCIVGYVDIPNSPEIDGGRFIVRNSWGLDWARDSVYGPGYGSIPYSYIARLGREAFSIS